MTLAKADIYNRVMNILGTNSSGVPDIDDELQDVLHDISVQGNFLQTSDSSLSTIADTAIVDASTLLVKNISEVWISGDNRLVRGSKEDYLKTIEHFDSPTTGEPKKFFSWGDDLYVYDFIPNDTYTLRVEYYKYHATSVAEIEYPDRYRKMIVDGVLKEVWGGVLRSLVDSNYADAEYRKFLADYQNELSKHRADLPTVVAQMMYRDI